MNPKHFDEVIHNLQAQMTNEATETALAVLSIETPHAGYDILSSWNSVIRITSKIFDPSNISEAHVYHIHYWPLTNVMVLSTDFLNKGTDEVRPIYAFNPNARGKGVASELNTAIKELTMCI